eukprot:Selendium_serpulae@DN11702_c0_g1_i1.p1
MKTQMGAPKINIKTDDTFKFEDKYYDCPRSAQTVTSTFDDSDCEASTDFAQTAAVQRDAVKSVLTLPRGRHLAITSRGGSGTADTIKQSVGLLSEKHKKATLVLAFKRALVEEMGGLPRPVKAQTIHSFGFGICIQNMGSVWVDKDKTEKTLRNMVQHDVYLKYRDPITRLIGLLKSCMIVNPSMSDMK